MRHLGDAIRCGPVSGVGVLGQAYLAGKFRRHTVVDPVQIDRYRGEGTAEQAGREQLLQCEGDRRNDSGDLAGFDLGFADELVEELA